MTRSTLLLTLALAAGTVVTGAQGRDIGLQVFSEINYRGASATILRDTPDISQSGMTGVISSLRAAPGEVWQVCTEKNYRGRCQTFTSAVADLRKGGWNDVIASVRRVRGGAGPSFGGGRGRPTGPGLEVFADVNFKGESAAFMTNTPDLKSSGMARTISSLRVLPGDTWEVCTEPDYKGRCQVVTKDISDLRRGNWNDVIASVRRVR